MAASNSNRDIQEASGENRPLVRSQEQRGILSWQSGEWKPRGDQQEVAAGQSLPGGRLTGFVYIVVDIHFLSQIKLIGFGLEQKPPGTGHLCGFAKHVTSLDLNSEVLLRGLRKEEETEVGG